ncbi:MAG: histidine phosphatase family protein [Ignavibacteriaceae bacterium]|nr:histidine phosphatase family protein [Ignavibacteriaceae bacterium]
MKKLTIVRHAKSDWNFTELLDHERPINGRGRADAPFMAVNIMKSTGTPDLVISSYANRAVTTAIIFARAMYVPEEKIQITTQLYDATAGKVMSVLQAIDDSYNNVMIFGHNPGLTNLVNYLSQTEYITDNLPTTGCVCFEFDIKSWKNLAQGMGKLVFFEYPKKNKNY